MNDLVKRLGLEVDPTDRIAVSRALKARLAQLHPDRTAGKFESEEAKNAFLEAQTALAAIDAAESTALIPLREVTSLVESLTKAVAPLGAVQEELLRTQRTREIRERVRVHHYAFKVTSGTLLAISSGLFAFMGALKDNPVLGRLLEVPGMDIALLGVWLYSAAFFGMSWIRERSAESYAEFLATDEGLADTFEQLRHRGLEILASGRKGFSRKHLVRAILEASGSHSWPFMLLGSGRVGRSAAEGIASVQLEKLLARGAIVLSPKKGLNEWFEVDSAVLTDS